MTQTTEPFAGIAGRRTFLREADDGGIIVYGITEKGAQASRFCTRAEWDEWCEQHAPPVAQPGMAVTGATRSVLVVRRLGSGDLEVSVTEQRIMSQDKADRLVRRLLAETGSAAAQSGPATDDDGA